MSFTIFKFGGMVLNIPTAFKKLTKTIINFTGNTTPILVISAFFGQTKKLKLTYETKDTSLFEDFITFHNNFAKELGIGKSMTLVVDSARLTFRKSFSVACSDKPSTGRDMARAEILALGEDLATFIVAEFLRLKSDKKRTVSISDSREVMISEPNFFLDVKNNREETKKRIRESFYDDQNMLYVVQGFVCGTPVNGEMRTSVFPMDGSDLTAALISALTFEDGEQNLNNLIFFKRFGKGSNSEIFTGSTGVKKLLKYMEDTGLVIVSPSVFHVKGLPVNFSVYDYDNPGKLSLFVAVESAMQEKLFGAKL